MPKKRNVNMVFVFYLFLDIGEGMDLHDAFVTVLA